MMQQSRRQHGGDSGELDVFGATSYFAAADDCARSVTDASDPAGRPARMLLEDSFGCGPHHVVPDEQVGDDDQRRHPVLGATKRSASGNKSKLAAIFSFMLSPSPSPRASFRKEHPPSPARPLQVGGDEPPSADHPESSSSSRESIQLQLLQGCGHHHGLDLGVATGDRRLKGVRIVRGIGCEERWVVRCSAWEEEDEEGREKMLGAGSSDERKDDDDQAEEGDDSNNPDDNWESDCSSDLFDLDIDQYIC